MQVFLQMVAFSLESDGSGRPVLAKGKRRKSNSALLPFSKFESFKMVTLVGKHMTTNE